MAGITRNVAVKCVGAGASSNAKSPDMAEKSDYLVEQSRTIISVSLGRGTGDVLAFTVN
jgi:hypothetical protein